MTDHAPQEAPRAADAPASSTGEENPRTFPEGIPVRDMMRVQYEPRASNEVLISPATRERAAPALREPSKTSTGTSSTTCPRRCCPPWSA